MVGIKGAKHPTREELQKFVDLALELGGDGRAMIKMGRAAGNAGHWRGFAREAGISAKGNSPEALRQQVNLLRKQLKDRQFEEDTAARIRQVIYGLASHTPEAPAWLAKESKASKQRGCPVTIWSDWHYGEVVRKEEVGGVNEFNVTVAKRRIQTLVDKTIELCFHHMGANEADYPGIVVCLGGDMISGDIHQELAETNDRTPYQAVNDLTDLIASALGEIADKFGKVYVPCVVGNHGRGTEKPRAKARVFTSFEWLIYTALERHFINDSRVQFDIPEQTDAHFSVYGHRYLLTHGDSLGVRGGDGIIGSIGPIMRGSLKVSKSEAQIGRDFDTVIMGHWHQTLWLPGVHVNNCLKGYDEYARLFLRAPYSRPSQSLWFSHPTHGITARWEVYLEAAAVEAAEKKTWLKVLA